MATESKANKNATATCIVQVVRLISLKLLKLATHETPNTDWHTPTCTLCLVKTNKFSYLCVSKCIQEIIIWFVYSRHLGTQQKKRVQVI